MKKIRELSVFIYSLYINIRILSNVLFLRGRITLGEMLQKTAHTAYQKKCHVRRDAGSIQPQLTSYSAL